MKDISPPRQPRALLGEGTEPEYVYTPEAKEFDWRDYWKVLVKRRGLLGVIVLLFVILGAYFSFTATKVYTATSLVRIEPQNPWVTGVAPIASWPEGTKDYYETQFAIMKSSRLAAKVVSDSKLESNETFTKASIVQSSMKSRLTSIIFDYLEDLISFLSPSEESFQKSPEKQVPPPSQSNRKSTGTSSPAAQTTKEESNAGQQQVGTIAYPWAGHYLKFLKVDPVKNTRLVQVQFTTPDPSLSQFLANAHAKAFIRLSMETRQELTEEARQFLDTKNVELKETLEKSEAKLNRFRQTHGVVSMEGGENIVVHRLVDVNHKLTDARAQRLEAESLKRTVENRPVQYLSQVLTQGLVPSLRGTLQTLEAERVKLSSTYKPDHPRMIELSQQITETRRTLNGEIANVVKGIEENYRAARAKEDALQAEAQKQQDLALNMKELGVEYAVLEEEVKVNRALYENVLNRLHSTSITNDVALSNIQVIQWAEKPNRPSGPHKLADIGLAAFLGLFLATGLIFGLEYLDSRVSTPQHVWRAAGLSTFGIVPDLNSLKPMLDYDRLRRVKLLSRLPNIRALPVSYTPSDLISEHHPLSMVTESYRTIRAALLFSRAEKPPQVIVLTSPSPGEGKTLTVLNLSVALAQDGYKVLVIDADLRKGRCHSRFGLANDGGLTSVLTSDIPPQDRIQETSVGGLSLLSRGVCPPNPNKVLASSKMKDMLTALRGSFDFILIDSPPAIAVSDAAVLSLNSDAVILVFHARKTTTASARHAIECLDSVRAPIIGTILNGVNIKNPDYAYYRHYYGSDYGQVEHNDNGLNNGGATDPVVQSRLTETKVNLKPMDLCSGLVPTEFFEHMIAKFGEAVGPMAPLIIRDQIRVLGESFESFPKSRLNELYQKLCEEILNEKLRQNFQSSMAVELHSI